MSDEPPIERWWCPQREAARLLGVHPVTVRQMIRDGSLPTVQVGRRRVVRLADIDAIKAGRAS